jgi:hypothetical protein
VRVEIFSRKSWRGKGRKVLGTQWHAVARVFDGCEAERSCHNFLMNLIYALSRVRGGEKEREKKKGVERSLLSACIRIFRIFHLWLVFWGSLGTPHAVWLCVPISRPRIRNG